MHSNRARIYLSIETCMVLFFCTIVTTSCWLYIRELPDAGKKFAATVNMKGISFFYLPYSYDPVVIVSYTRHENYGEFMKTLTIDLFALRVTT